MLACWAAALLALAPAPLALAPSVLALAPSELAPAPARAAQAPARAAPTPAQRVLAALDASDRLQPLVARAELRAVLEQGLSGPPAEAGPELALAARALLSLDDALEDWPATEAWHAALAAARARAGGATAESAALLAQGHATALRALGRCDEARALARELGLISDGWVLGPFDNERGAGYARAFAPELGMTLATRVAGRARELHWRRNPAPGHPLGRVLLHEILRPRQDGVAYFATVLESPRAQEARIVLSTNCAWRAWLGGREIGARAARRPALPDQDWIPVRLEAGRNELLLKLANEDQEAWAFALRIADGDGRGLPEVRARPEWFEGGMPVASASAAAADLDPPALRALTERADPLGAALCAQLEYHAHVGDAQDPRLVLRAERWTALEPDAPAAWHALAHALRGRLPRALEEDALDRRLQAWRRVLELDPRHAGALASLAEHYLSDAPQPEQADLFSARALAAAPQSARALALRAQHLEGRGRALEARVLREAAAAAPESAHQPWAVVQRAAQRRANGDADGALADLRAAFEQRRLAGPVRDALRLRLVDAGRYDEALALEQELLAGAPFEVDALLVQAELDELAGAPERARERLAAALALCPEEPQVWRALARIEQRLSDGAGADRAYAALLALEPGDARARRARALLAPENATDFETPYRWDGLARAAERRAEGPAPADEPVEVVARTKVWKVDADGTEHAYEHVLLRIGNERGARMLDTWPIVHASGAQPFVHTLRAIRPDGSFERATPPRQARATGDGRVARVWDLPPLGTGDCVEAEWRIDESGPDLFGRYFGARHLFQADYPDPPAAVVFSELIVLSAPRIDVYVEERNGDRLEHEISVDEQGLRRYRFEARKLPRLAPEGFMPPREELLPVVDLSTYSDWAAFGRWWWSFLEKELDTSTAMRAKVAELTAGRAGERERVEAILRFVAQEVRYNSWPFGTHGYEPYSASTIFERRLGDCKDKTILLRQMLAEIGVAARPVLLRAQHRRGSEPLRAAMVEHFDHCIAWVEPTETRAGYFLDATAEHNPLDYLREDDQGAEVLIVGPDGVERAAIPYASADAHRLVRRYRVELAPDGGGRVALRDESVGGFGVRLRERYAGHADARATRLAAEYERGLGKVVAGAIQSSDLDDLGAPAWLEAELDAAQLWTEESGGTTLPLAFDALGILDAAVESPGERRHNLVFDRPFGLDTAIEWRLPAGRQLRALPAPVRIELAGLLEYRCEARAIDGGVAVERSFRLHERRIPLARYAEFQDALRRIASAERARIELGAAGEERR